MSEVSSHKPDASRQPSLKTAKHYPTISSTSLSKLPSHKPDASRQPSLKTVKHLPTELPSYKPDASRQLSLKTVKHLPTSRLTDPTQAHTVKPSLLNHKPDPSPQSSPTSNIQHINFTSSTATPMSAVEEQTDITPNCMHVCSHCGKSYRQYASLYKHIKKSHCEDTGGQIHCMENGCLFTCHYIAQLREHLTGKHDINIAEETIMFSNLKGEYTISIQ